MAGFYSATLSTSPAFQWPGLSPPCTLIRERTRAGLAAARARGRIGGRRKSLTSQDIALARTLLANPDIPVIEIARKLRVSEATFYRWLPGGRSGRGAQP